MKATILYAFYYLEGMRKMLAVVTLLLTLFVGHLIEKTQSYSVLLGISMQIPCMLTLVTSQRRMKQHQDRWDKYVACLPMSRKKIIQGEFLLFAVMAGVSIGLMMILVIYSTILGYTIKNSDLGILLGLPLYLSMVSQLFIFLFSNQSKDNYTELWSVVSICITCLLLCFPYFLKKEFFVTQYESNPQFGIFVFTILCSITGIITVFIYKISLNILKKREY